MNPYDVPEPKKLNDSLTPAAGREPRPKRPASPTLAPIDAEAMFEELSREHFDDPTVPPPPPRHLTPQPVEPVEASTMEPQPLEVGDPNASSDPAGSEEDSGDLTLTEPFHPAAHRSAEPAEPPQFVTGGSDLDWLEDASASSETLEPPLEGPPLRAPTPAGANQRKSQPEPPLSWVPPGPDFVVHDTPAADIQPLSIDDEPSDPAIPDPVEPSVADEAEADDFDDLDYRPRGDRTLVLGMVAVAAAIALTAVCAGLATVVSGASATADQVTANGTAPEVDTPVEPEKSTAPEPEPAEPEPTEPEPEPDPEPVAPAVEPDPAPVARPRPRPRPKPRPRPRPRPRPAPVPVPVAPAPAPVVPGPAPAPVAPAPAPSSSPWGPIDEETPAGQGAPEPSSSPWDTPD